MEPETSKPEGSQGFASFFHGLLASHVQEDGMRHRNSYHVAHLRGGDQYEVGGIQLVRRILTGTRSMPHIQMHVGNAKGLRGNIVRLIHEPHSHVQGVLPIEHTSSRGQHQSFSGTVAMVASTKLGPFGFESHSRRLRSGTAQSTSFSKGLVKPSAPRYTADESVCSSNEGGVRYSWFRTL